MLHIYQIIFNKRIPRVSMEAKTNLLQVGNWFVEELFTYVWVFGSLYNPHVLPLYGLNKLMSREIVYQTIGNGISKVLRESNKKVWYAFPIHCGMYTLENFKHETREINFILELNFPTIPMLMVLDPPTC